MFPQLSIGHLIAVGALVALQPVICSFLGRDVLVSPDSLFYHLIVVGFLAALLPAPFLVGMWLPSTALQPRAVAGDGLLLLGMGSLVVCTLFCDAWFG